MKLAKMIKCPNCGETLNLEKEERIEKRFSCSNCRSSIDMQNLIDCRFEYFWVIKDLLENCLGSQPERTLLVLIATPLITIQVFDRAKENLTNTTNKKLSFVHALLSNILLKQMFLRDISKEDVEEYFKGESIKVIPAGVTLHRECEMLVKQTFVVAEEIKVQLSDIFVWGLSPCFMKSDASIWNSSFYVGALFFNENSVTFIPYHKKFDFGGSAGPIGRPVGGEGLAGNTMEYRMRGKQIKSATRKMEIQTGMTLLQKFLYNIGRKKSYSGGYLYLPKTEITNVKIESDVLLIKTKETTVSIGGFLIVNAKKEIKENISYWLNNQYKNVSETFSISKTVPPKVLLDDLVDGIEYTRENIDAFMKESENTLLFCRLFKSLSEEQQTQVINHLEKLSSDLANKLKDNEFMASIKSLEKSNKACFIATVSYGGSNKTSVKILRDYRDEFLLKSHIGQKFVEQYYRWSPPVAKFVSNRPILKATIRRSILDPIVWFAQRQIKNNVRK